MGKKKVIIGLAAGLAICVAIGGFFYSKRIAKESAGVSTVSLALPKGGQADETANRIHEVLEEKKKRDEEAKEAAAKEEAERQMQQEEAEKRQKAEAKVVALDPGHQSFSIDMSAKEPNGPGSQEMKAKCTSGTSGQYTGIPEYQLVLDISQMLRTELENRGYQVVMTREDNETAISNAERALMASDYGANIYVRIHANGSENTSASGALALVPSENNPYVAGLAGESYTLAELVLNAYCGQTGFANKGIQQNDTMTGINWSKIPVMILEMGFMSNENDDYSMADAAFRVLMVQGIADGIDQYFGVL